MEDELRKILKQLEDMEYGSQTEEAGHWLIQRALVLLIKRAVNIERTGCCIKTHAPNCKCGYL